MSKRKTVSVRLVTERVNHLLAYRESRGAGIARLSPEQAYRAGAASVLALILHETGNYAGFGYLDVDHTADPPIIPDESRRQYYVK
jgi:hypothetical protein